MLDGNVRNRPEAAGRRAPVEWRV